MFVLVSPGLAECVEVPTIPVPGRKVGCPRSNHTALSVSGSENPSSHTPTPPSLGLGGISGPIGTSVPTVTRSDSVPIPGSFPDILSRLLTLVRPSTSVGRSGVVELPLPK